MRALPVFLFCLVLSIPCAAAVFPRIEAPSAYTATAEDHGVVYEAFLRLRAGHVFILHERALLPGGRTEERSLTGTWRQVGGGALLQLANRNGLALRLNVGGAGDLYGDIRALRVRTVHVTLKKTEDRPRPYAVMGLLSFEDGNAALRDAASGRVFSLAPDARLDALAVRGTPLFVDVDVEEQGAALRLARLRGSSTRLPTPADRSPAMFARIADSGPWRLNVPGLPPLRCTFARAENKKGAFEVAGQGLRLRAAYEIGENGIVFHVEEADARLAEAVGFGALSRLLARIRYWDVEGDVLVFSEKEKTLCIMERAGAVRAEGGKRSPNTPGLPDAIAGDPPRRVEHGEPIWTGWSRK